VATCPGTSLILGSEWRGRFGVQNWFRSSLHLPACFVQSTIGSSRRTASPRPEFEHSLSEIDKYNEDPLLARGLKVGAASRRGASA
jgi:hypothetical protein